MSFADDHYEDLVISDYQRINCIQRHVEQTENEVIIRDAKSIADTIGVDSYSSIDLVRGIVATIERNRGKMSEKQKIVLCRFLVDNHDQYDIQDEDHPLYA